MISNPVLGYKLDPGEPGIPHFAPASRSIMRVLSQEISNLIYFKKEALRKGGMIIYSNIALDLRKRGSFLAAVAGRTQVFIYTPETKSSERTHSLGSELQNKQQEIERKILELERRLKTETDPLERERLKEDLERLKLALNILKASLRAPELLVGVLLDSLV
ncbi:hypothetical protein [Thermotoga sp. 38H-to]|uniref:hypothetical protein n=1 Tax=Thermotoga sp. 38H-to TaxID=1755812 RepID=UPI0013ED2CBF|nr:hypothetical protein [Thermotoga sp. 38H-to]KAF2959783.1 hypothetical protein AS158_04870 [Thermotoga sp. 38H-to]